MNTQDKLLDRLELTCGSIKMNRTNLYKLFSIFLFRVVRFENFSSVIDIDWKRLIFGRL